MTPTQQSALRLPPQDLERCSLFETNPESLRDWVDKLPLGNPARVGARLRTGISELNRVPLPPALRFALLELTRPATHSVIAALTRSCLNQPIAADDDTQLQADLIVDLCTLSATGYTITAIETIRGADELRDIHPAKLACESLHRSMMFSGQRVLLAYLLYQPVELNCWASLHQLYALTERQQLARLPVEDPVLGTRSTIAQEYIPPLLLACAKPNQLRQHDIKGAYRAFNEWRDFVKLRDTERDENLFTVDLHSDQPPVFTGLLRRHGGAQFRYIDTTALIKHIEDLKNSRGAQGLRVIEFDRETRLDTNLLGHLIKTLGEVSQRNFTRQPATIALDIAAGLSNVHFYVAGEQSLEQVFHGADYEPASGDSGDNPFFKGAGGNPFLKSTKRDDKSAKRDDRQQQADAQEKPGKPAAAEGPEPGPDMHKIAQAAREKSAPAPEPKRQVVYFVKTTNTSPGGYCVEWSEAGDDTHIGDVVCVRETGVRQAGWTIAVIRWVNPVKDGPTLLGLELLSPRGSAYAARIKMPSGDYSKPIRVLLLPEIPLVGQSHTLIVPRMVFKEGQLITLTREEDGFLIRLKRQVASTGYFSQLDFEYLRQLDNDMEKSWLDSPSSTFDSIWSKI